MNADLQRARRALEAGEPQVASVFAWNALGGELDEPDRAELVRLADELNDVRLLQELERRGFGRPARQAPVAQAQKQNLLRFLPVALVFLFIAGFGATQIPTESTAPKPTAVESPDGVPHILDLSSGVWLVPVGRAESVDLLKLSAELTFRYGVPVGVQAEVHPTDSMIEDDRLVAEQILSLLALSYGAEGRATFIGVTDYDMDSPTEGHVFSLRRDPHYGIVSTAQLGASLIDRLRGNMRHERTRKLLARNMAFLYLRRPMVDDPKSLTRPKMSSIGDIDDLEERL